MILPYPHCQRVGVEGKCNFTVHPNPLNIIFLNVGDAFWKTVVFSIDFYEKLSYISKTTIIKSHLSLGGSYNNVHD